MNDASKLQTKTVTKWCAYQMNRRFYLRKRRAGNLPFTAFWKTLQRLSYKIYAMNLPTWTEAGIDVPRKTAEMNHFQTREQHDGSERERYRSQPQYNTENVRPVQANRQYADASVDLDSSRASYNRINTSDGNFGRTNIRSDRDILDTFDAFKYREVCLNSSSKTKMVANFLNKIKDHINKEACLEAEVGSVFRL